VATTRDDRSAVALNEVKRLGAVEFLGCAQDGEKSAASRGSHARE
jgi:hypothetical protein